MLAVMELEGGLADMGAAGHSERLACHAGQALQDAYGASVSLLIPSELTAVASKPARRRPVVAGGRVRHILGAERICTEVHGLQCVVEWEAGEREVLLMGFLEAIPGEFT